MLGVDGSTTIERQRSLSSEDLRETLHPRPRSRVVSRPRIHIEISDEEVDSDLEIESLGLRAMSVSKPGSRNSVLTGKPKTVLHSPAGLLTSGPVLFHCCRVYREGHQQDACYCLAAEEAV